VRSHESLNALNIEPLFRIEKFHLHWFGQVSRMSQKRVAKQILLATPSGKRLGNPPRTSWQNCNSDLDWLILM